MTASNMKVQQQTIGDFNELLSEGSIKLQELFRSILSEQLHPVEPLHYITKRESLTIDLTTKLTMDRIAISHNFARESVDAWSH